MEHVRRILFVPHTSRHAPLKSLRAFRNTNLKKKKMIPLLQK